MPVIVLMSCSWLRAMLTLGRLAPISSASSLCDMPRSRGTSLPVAVAACSFSAESSRRASLTSMRYHAIAPSQLIRLAQARAQKANRRDGHLGLFSTNPAAPLAPSARGFARIATFGHGGASKAGLQTVGSRLEALGVCALRHSAVVNAGAYARAASNCPTNFVPRLRAQKERVMKIIISALFALSVFAAIAAPASADYNPREDVGIRSPL